jgi:DNA repair protein RecO (recombination protein O)
MEFNERGIVLRLGGFREADLWVHLLSPARGVFSAFAFGGSKSRRRFCGCLDMFNELRFQLKETPASYLTLQEGMLLKGPERLRRDRSRLGMAVNCALFVESFCKGPDGADKTHALFADLLNSLESNAPLSPFLPMFFRARLAFEQGYALNPRSCSLCGASLLNGNMAGEKSPAPAALCVDGSGLLCRGCAAGINSGVRRFPLGQGSLKILRMILENSISAWRVGPEDENSQKECVRATEAFLQYHLGLRRL